MCLREGKHTTKKEKVMKTLIAAAIGLMAMFQVGFAQQPYVSLTREPNVDPITPQNAHSFILFFILIEKEQTDAWVNGVCLTSTDSIDCDLAKGIAAAVESIKNVKRIARVKESR